ncbi:hypothetical protein WM31_20270 [Burkholderia ubonensis]|nr:hypothetical protein WM31_20270 [Burkholderia ubonensis]
MRDGGLAQDSGQQLPEPHVAGTDRWKREIHQVTSVGIREQVLERIDAPCRAGEQQLVVYGRMVGEPGADGRQLAVRERVGDRREYLVLAGVERVDERARNTRLLGDVAYRGACKPVSTEHLGGGRHDSGSFGVKLGWFVHTDMLTY